jgi:hypothetical protein
MKLNPKIAKKPEDFAKLEFKKFKPLIKKDLLRLEKQTSKKLPTDFILIGKHIFTDKPNTPLPMLALGKWKAAIKTFAKKEVIARKEKDSLIGEAYFAGEENEKKVIQLLIWKGKGKETF